MADQARVRAAKLILVSAAVLGVLALGTWVAVPPTTAGRALIALTLAGVAVADALFGLFLLTRS
jgi:hypothetical protein